MGLHAWTNTNTETMHNKTPPEIVDDNTTSGTLHLTLLCIASFPDPPRLQFLITFQYTNTEGEGLGDLYMW